MAEKPRLKMEGIFKDLPTRKLGRGQVLIYEGDPVDHIYLLASGFVKVYNLTLDGGQRTIFLYAPGDMFPLTSFLSGAGVARYFYECMTDAEVKMMPQDRFLKIIKGDMDMGEQLITYTYRLNNLFAERIEILTAKSARHKVASLLAYLADRAGIPEKNMIKLSLPLTSQTIADMCSLTRETASLQLQRLRKEGFVQGGRHISVNLPKLQKLLAS